MLYEFKCRAAGRVVMTQPVAEQVLAIIGKPARAAGVVTVDALPAAIAALEQAVRAEREQGAPADEEDDDPYAPRKPRPVSLAQRAWPLLELMREALAARREITWGV